MGRIDATNYLDKNSLANNPESQFLNASLNNMLMWGNFLTFSTYGAIFVAPVTDGMKIAAAAWTPDTQPDDNGGDWSDYGVVINPMSNPRYHAGKSQLCWAQMTSSVEQGSRFKSRGLKH